MRRARRARAGGAVGIVCALGCASCADDPLAPSTTTSATTTTVGSTATSTTSSTSASDGGEPPIWQDAPSPLPQCPWKRLANPGKVRAFQWKPCGDQPACEEALREPWLEYTKGFNYSTYVYGDAQSTRMMLTVNGAPTLDWYVLVTDDAGWVLDGYFETMQADLPTCILNGGGLRGDRFGVLLLELAQNKSVTQGLLLDRLNASGEPILAHPVQATPECTALVRVMGDSRWTWWCDVPQRLASVSLEDGGDYTMYAQAQETGPVLLVANPVGTGSLFLHEQVDLVDGGIHGYVAQSDGVAPATPYLEPSGTDYFGGPLFAHSHVAWFRGIGFKQVNLFDSVEVWASEFDPDPGKLSPYKVADLGYPNIPFGDSSSGGYGFVGVTSNDGAPVFPHVWLFDLAAKAMRTITMPGAQAANFHLGITPSHIYFSVAAEHTTMSTSLVRFSLR